MGLVRLARARLRGWRGWRALGPSLPELAAYAHRGAVGQFLRGAQRAGVGAGPLTR
jgi:hypothetical protein